MNKRKRARSSLSKTVETVVNSLVARVVKDEKAAIKTSSEKSNKTVEASVSSNDSKNARQNLSRQKKVKSSLKKDGPNQQTEKKTDRIKSPTSSKKVKSSLVKQKISSPNTG